MRRTLLIALIIPLLLLFGCQRTNVNRLLPASLVESVKIGLLAVDETFRLSKDNQVVRYVAVSSATMLAREAITTILMRQADRFDPIFGEGRTKVLFADLLADHCYPLLNDLIISEIDRRLQHRNPSPDGNTDRTDASVLVKSYLTRYGFEQVPRKIIDFIAPDSAAPENRAVPGINHADFAATRNWKDSGRIYEYRIVNDSLQLKCAGGPWEHLPLPDGRVPRIVAADNNRCFVVTADRQLWWYCVKQDQAQWSIDIMNSAVELMSLKSLLGDEVCKEVLTLLTRVTDSVATRAAGASKFLADWKTANGSNPYWSDRCRGLTQVLLNVESLLLKTGDGKTFTADDYSSWSREAHREGAWSNALAWQSGGRTFTRGGNVPVDSIVDIAIGNWNGTVVTLYALACGKIWFIDEEIIQPEWKPVENWNSKWAIVAREFNPIANTPYPLDTSCRIDAANSVIAVSKKNDSASFIFWCRWDYHQKDDFVYWPLDWCEHAWYSVACPSRNNADFRISTIGTVAPGRRGTVWSVPAPYFTFHTYLPQAGYQGIFGDIPREQVSWYPVDLFVADTGGTMRRFSVEKAQSVTTGKVRWE